MPHLGPGPARHAGDSCHLCQCRFGLRQPQCHLHVAVERDGGGQGGASLLPLAGGGVQGAQAQVTVGLQWAHAKLLGQGQGLLVGGFGLRNVGGVGVGMDNAKLVQRERLVPACLVLPGQVERLARVLPGLLAASRQTTDLAEPCDPVADLEVRPCGYSSLIASSSSAHPSARRPWSA